MYEKVLGQMVLITFGIHALLENNCRLIDRDIVHIFD